MDAIEYIDILENVLLPSIRRIYSEDDMPTFRLVQDNSAVHTAHVVWEWFAQHPEVEVLDWPAKSPDLNLIENIWAAIANSWDSGHERTRAQLVAHAKTVWESLRQKPELF
ncbi:transposable element tc3 transposase [Lasius niger]|uniref:Transposable element tc3 transposase n=1 Tax=Lasius niger TaxID=67767 RepID=A0A0J7JY56_LASNI|nr:transposable element tc3 transposase [Lasius niger]